MEKKMASNREGPSVAAATAVAPIYPSWPSEGAKRNQGVGRLSDRIRRLAEKRTCTVTRPVHRQR